MNFTPLFPPIPASVSVFLSDSEYLDLTIGVDVEAVDLSVDTDTDTTLSDWVEPFESSSRDPYAVAHPDGIEVTI